MCASAFFFVLGETFSWNSRAFGLYLTFCMEILLYLFYFIYSLEFDSFLFICIHLLSSFMGISYIILDVPCRLLDFSTPIDPHSRENSVKNHQICLSEDFLYII